MFSLSYTSAYDPYHTLFRFMCLLKHLNGQPIEYNKLRYADFYLCFPWLISDISGTRSISNFTKKRNAIVKQYTKNSYEILPDKKTLFDRMEVIQLSSLSSLISEEIATGSSPNYNDLKLVDKDVNPALRVNIDKFIEQHKDLISFLIEDLMQLEYLGSGGLKDKTQLEEYRYDDV